MQYLDLAYTRPYLMSLHPDREMDIAILGRPEIQRAVVEYGPTPLLIRGLPQCLYDMPRFFITEETSPQTLLALLEGK